MQLIEFSANRVFRFAVALLDDAEELVDRPFSLLEVVVGQLTPQLFRFAFHHVELPSHHLAHDVLPAGKVMTADRLGNWPRRTTTSQPPRCRPREGASRDFPGPWSS